MVEIDKFAVFPLL